MARALVAGETLDWPTFSRFKFEVGDLVFFYASSPVLQMIGNCEIEAVGIPFGDVDPRNDLRKWPMRFSRIPWMRLRVLQSVPVPFRPLQRGSLYYHTEFKPSPYPKLLHEGELEYVQRAFREAAEYKSDLDSYDGGIDPAAIVRVENGEKLRAFAHRLKGGRMLAMRFEKESSVVSVVLRSAEGEALELIFRDVRRARWDYDSMNAEVAGLRLTIDNTYLLTNIDGADIELMSGVLAIV